MNKLLIVHTENLKIVAEIIGRSPEICEEWARRCYRTNDIKSPYAYWLPNEINKLPGQEQITEAKNCLRIDLSESVGIENNRHQINMRIFKNEQI